VCVGDRWRSCIWKCLWGLLFSCIWKCLWGFGVSLSHLNVTGRVEAFKKSRLQHLRHRHRHHHHQQQQQQTHSEMPSRLQPHDWPLNHRRHKQQHGFPALLLTRAGWTASTFASDLLSRRLLRHCSFNCTRHSSAFYIQLTIYIRMATTCCSFLAAFYFAAF
jgi:hypothetical protein